MIEKISKMKKVLIALDYDPTAQKVAETGFLLAKSMSAEVTLLHVITEATYYSALDYSPITGLMGFNGIDASVLFDEGGVKKAMDDFLVKSKHFLGDDKIETLVTEGDCAESILSTATNLHADVIVIGSHSRKWLENIILGSIAEKVLQHTTIPLFIVPTKQIK